jgi:hypothetical protein
MYRNTSELHPPRFSMLWFPGKLYNCTSTIWEWVLKEILVAIYYWVLNIIWPHIFLGVMYMCLLYRKQWDIKKIGWDKWDIHQPRPQALSSTLWPRVESLGTRKISITWLFPANNFIFLKWQRFCKERRTNFQLCLKKKQHVLVENMKILQENTKMMHRYSFYLNNMMYLAGNF